MAYPSCFTPGGPLLCALVGKEQKISVALKYNKKSHHAIGTIIYCIIKVNVMALDFTAYNLPFNQNRDSTHISKKTGQFNFPSISCAGLFGAHPLYSYYVT